MNRNASFEQDVDLVKYTFTKQNATPTQTIEWPHSEVCAFYYSISREHN